MRRAAATVARLARDASRHASASVGVEFRRPPARALAPSHPSRGFASADAPSSDPSSPASPSARSASPASSSSARVAFASGLSKRESLAEAVVEAVAEVKAGLGHDVQPTWVQLMVSGDYEDASLAPAFALECFTTTTAPASTSSAADSDSREPPPALFGGVVTGCVGGRGQCMDGPCVSVTAAKMPGVRAIPFRVDDASLPPQVDWAAAMRDAAGDGDGDARAPSDGKPERKTEKENSKKPKNGLALLVFADADFVEVDDLARRVHALLPDAVVVGGVAAPGGALFHGGGGGFESGGESSSGGALSDAAAVGIALQGPMRVEAHALHACRPVGPTMTLTRAGVEGVVLELDGEPAGAALTRALADVPEGSAGFPVALGIGEVLPVFADDNTQTSPHSSETKKFGDGNDDASGEALRSSGDANRSASRSADRSADRSANAHARSGRARGGSASSLRGRVVRPETDPSDDRDRDRDRARRAATEAAETATASAAYASGAGSGYVFRDIVGADRATGGVFVGRHPLEEGAPVRVHVRDAAWGKRASRALMRPILGEQGARGAEEGGGGEGSSGLGGVGEKDDAFASGGRVAGAVMFTCASGDRMHAANFRDAAGGGVPVGGAYVAGEIAPARRGGQSFVLSHTSALGVFRDP